MVTATRVRVPSWNAGAMPWPQGVPTWCAYCLTPAVADVATVLLPGAEVALPVHSGTCQTRMQREYAEEASR